MDADNEQELLGLAAEEHTCRICRGEGTEDSPLFYPCKCRGSIKYIHQDCLEEWLKHSGRKDSSCDICHQKYKFTTVYQDNTPDRVPVWLILVKMKNSLQQCARYALAVAGLGIGCGVQIPLFWAIASRFFTWAADNVSKHDDFFVQLVYGDMDFKGNPWDPANLTQAFIHTYLTSLVALIVFIIVHLVLYLEHEWVSKDPGFKSLVKKNIGEENRINNEWLRAQRMMLRGANNNNANNANNANINNVNINNHEERVLAAAEANLQVNLRNLENLQRILNQANNNDQVVEDALRLLLDRQGDLQRQMEARRAVGVGGDDVIAEQQEEPVFHGDINYNNGDNRDLLDEENEVEDPDFELSDDSEDDSTHSDPDIEDENDEFERFLRFNQRENNGIEALERERRNMRRRVDNLVDQDQHQEADVNRLNAFPPFVAPVRPNVPQAQRAQRLFNAQPQQQAARPPRVEVQAQPLGFDQEDLLLSLPIYMIVTAANVILAAYLMLAYFLPTIFGTILFQTLACVSYIGRQSLIKSLIYLRIYPYYSQVIDTLLWVKNYNPEFSTKLDNYILDPVLNVVMNVYEQNTSLTTMERIVPLFLFYGAAFSAVLLYLRYQNFKYSQDKPLTGMGRKLYIFWYDVVCSLKVFLIFGIELILFPAFCGLLLELVLSPIFTYKSKFVLNCISIASDYLGLRILLNWAVGTIYMCVFALFVGMTRRYIIRPGVLFFIRSPEDPNTRLVHDALVRPLSLQLSRIALSGLVYTMFILIGFGVVTYGLKTVGSEFLPIYYGSLRVAPFVVFLLHNRVIQQICLPKKYIRQYWTRAFKICANKTRLSSFILGRHDPKERGHVKYKSVLAYLKGSKPDYTQPKTDIEARDLFKLDPSIDAVFVPDGYFVRAPKNDTVSRKYIRNLFVPVTKDDVLLGSPTRNRANDLDEFDDSEDELTTTNQYEIVYRPPTFGARISMFLIMLWVFAVILICGTLFVSNTLGKPICFALCALTEKYFEDISAVTLFDESFSPYSLYRLDLAAIAIGLRIMFSCLQKYDEYLIKKHTQGDGQERAEESERNVKLRKFLVWTGEKLTFVGKFVFTIANIVFRLFWCAQIQEMAVHRPHAFFEGNGSEGGFSTSPTVLLLDIIVGATLTYSQIKSVAMNECMRVFQMGLGLAVEGSYERLFLPNVIQFAKVQLPVIIFKLGVALYEYFSNPNAYTSMKASLVYVIVQEGVHKSLMIAVWPTVVAINIGYIFSQKLSGYLSEVNAQVKEQYYSKGKTLENAEEAGTRLNIDETESLM